MRNYLSVPFSPEDIHGRFQYVDKPEQLSTADEALLAAQLATTVEMGHRAVWFNPETDRRQARIHGQPAVINGRFLRYALNDEGAIFPSRDSQL